MEDVFVWAWFDADAIIGVAFFALLHKLFSDRQITPLMMVHLALVVTLVLVHNYIHVALSRDDPWGYLPEGALSVGWSVLLVLLMLWILNLPSRLSYDAVLKKKIWGAFYNDIGVSEHINKQKEL